MRYLILTAFVFSTAAFAAPPPSCTDGYSELEVLDLDGSDLVEHSKMPAGWDGYAKSACISQSEEELDNFRVKVETGFRVKMEKALENHLKLGQPKLDISCRFESVQGLAGIASFDRPEAGTAMAKKLARDCGSNPKKSHFAFVKIPFSEAMVRMRCGKAEWMHEWEQACALPRAPASVKKKK